MYVDILGYKYQYRINEDGIVQRLLDNGTWRTMTSYISGRKRACVKMIGLDNRRFDVPVVKLMANAFMGGQRPGHNIIHKNGYKLDCSLGNLKFVTKSQSCKISASNRRKSVEKVDREGNVVEIYSSAREAARKNHMSRTAMWHRCTNKVQDPYSLDGFNYRYEVG